LSLAPAVIAILGGSALSPSTTIEPKIRAPTESSIAMSVRLEPATVRSCRFSTNAGRETPAIVCEEEFGGGGGCLGLILSVYSPSGISLNDQFPFSSAR